MYIDLSWNRVSRLIRKLGYLIYSRIGIVFTRAYRSATNSLPVETRLQVDNDTELPEMTLQTLVESDRQGSVTLVPDVDVTVKSHTLSVQSRFDEEKQFYSDHVFNAKGLTLEALNDYYWFPESGFLISPEGRVWRNSVLGQYADPNYLTTYAVEDRQRKDGSVDYIFHEHLLHNAPVIDQPRLITSHYASHNYGHFMLDMVPLIQLARDEEIDMISRPLLDWQLPIYKRIGVSLDKVQQTHERVVFMKRVYVSNRHNAVSTYAAAPAHRNVFEAILKNIIKDSNNGTSYGSKIFLSRGSSKHRKIKNRQALENALQKEGFDVIRPGTMPFDEQAILFSRADTIVTEFGAVMTNVVFCRPGTTVIEIIPENQRDPWSAHLCASMNLQHVTLFHRVKEEERKPIKIAGRQHKDIYFSYEVDVELVVKVVRGLVYPERLVD